MERVVATLGEATNGAPSAAVGARVASPTGTRRLPALDGIRGVALLAVHALHSLDFGPATGEGFLARRMDFLGRCGWVGVDLFFVLSGFLITGILLRNHGKTRVMAPFYVRRAVRILPIYYVVLLGTLFVAPLLDHGLAKEAGDVRENLGWYVTFTHNWLNLRYNGWPPGDKVVGQLWSLAIEEQFYLVWPFVVLFTKPRILPALCVLVILGAPAARLYGVFHGMSNEAIYPLTVCRADSLAAGALLAALLHRGIRPTARIGVGMAVAGGALFVATAPIARRLGERASALVHNGAYTWGLMLWAGVLALALCHPGTARVLAWKPLRLVGFYSYATYLISYPLTYALGLWWNRVLPAAGVANQALFFTVSMVLSMAVAWCTWNLLEKRVLALAGPPPVFS